MNSIRKALFVIIIPFLPFVLAQAENSFIFEELNVFSGDELAQAIYESSIIRGLSEGSQMPFDEKAINMTKVEFQNKVQVIGSLINFLCAQVYVNHLKDLRAVASGKKTLKDLDMTNHFNKNDGPSIHSRLMTVSRQGAASGIKLRSTGNAAEIAEVIIKCMNHLSVYLCAEFEASYRKLFDIEGIEAGAIQNPYYSLFCDSLSSKNQKIKEELNK